MFLPDPQARPILRDRLPLAGVPLGESTAHWLTRFGQYWAMDLPVGDLLDDRSLGWGEVASEGPLVVDGWSQVPLVGLDVLNQAREQGQSTVRAWMGAYPRGDWSPLPNAELDAEFSVGEALVSHLANPSNLFGEEGLRRVVQEVRSPRVASHVNAQGQSLMGVLLARLLVAIPQQHPFVLSAIKHALERGANNRMGNLDAFSEVLTPWGMCLKNYRPSPSAADPHPAMPAQLVEMFLASDLDLGEPIIREWTSTWLSIWRPANDTNNPHDMALSRLKHRWFDAMEACAPLPDKPRVRM